MTRRFRFQRFTVDDNRSAMKVGIDSVLLGAWVDMGKATRIVDIGTGCGLLALMAAQRSELLQAMITAVEVDAEAADQARYNVHRSPWPDRIRVLHTSWQQFVMDDGGFESGFELAICNPPFFQSGIASKKESRYLARHAMGLTRLELIRGASIVLSPTGRLALILPADQARQTLTLANHCGLFLGRQTWVRSLPDRPYHRVLMEFQREDCKTNADVITLETTHHELTPEFSRLTKQFYLRFASDSDSDTSVII